MVKGDSNRRWRRIFLILAAVIGAYALLAPLTSLDAAQSANVPLLADRLWFRLATIIAMFIVMATAWNIIGGITGYAAFGNVAFFGIGAYTTGMLIAKAKWPFLAALPLAPLVAGAFAALVGLPLLRLRGHYFAVASLGVGVAVGELVQNIDYHGQAVFGGASGLFLPIYSIDNRGLFFFYLMLAAAAAAIAVTWWVLRSKFGYGLIAIRENEEAAEVMGINTTLTKVYAYMLSAALAALGGAVIGYKLTNMTTEADALFSTTNNLQMIIICLIGGVGTLWGPWIGSFILFGLQEALRMVSSSAEFLAWQGVIFALLVVLVVLFLPRGVMLFIATRTRLTWRVFARNLVAHRI